MQPIAVVPWIVLGVLLAVFAPKVRSAIAGWLLVLAGIAVFAVRLHHEGPYPFPGGMDFAAGCAALLVGALLIRSPWSPREGGTFRQTRVLLGVSLETVLEARSRKYLAQRIALATGMWKHFSDRHDLDEIAVALRFAPCPD